MVKTPKSRLKVCIGLPQKIHSDSNFDPPQKKLTALPNHWLCHKMVIRIPTTMHYVCFWLQTQPQDTSEHPCIHTHACGVLENTLNAFKERKSVSLMTPKAYFGHSKLTPLQKKIFKKSRSNFNTIEILHEKNIEKRHKKKQRFPLKNLVWSFF